MRRVIIRRHTAPRTAPRRTDDDHVHHARDGRVGVLRRPPLDDGVIDVGVIGCVIQNAQQNHRRARRGARAVARRRGRRESKGHASRVARRASRAVVAHKLKVQPLEHKQPL